MFTRVVRSSTVAAAATIVVACYLSSGALAQPRVHPSSPAVNQHAPKKPRPVVRLTTRAFGPVTIGTGLTSGERTLRARLGPPTRVTNGGCELSGEKARSLTWGPLNADFSDRNRVGGRLLLVGWRVYPGVSRFTVSLPYKVAVGTPTPAAKRRIPNATGSFVPIFGVYELTSKRAPGVVWFSAKRNGTGPITLIALNLEACE